MMYTKVPMERIAVIVGPGGSVLEELQKKSGAKVKVDSESGEVYVGIEKAKDPVTALKAVDVVKAIARGFSPERAYRLFEEETYLTLIDIHDFAGKSQKRMRQVRGRIIGRKGKTRELIEELSGADISIYGSTIAVIGDGDETSISVRAITMLLEGSEHASVYHYLEGQREYLKVSRLGMDYYERR
ncbi:MAG: KH domain-containing protein [Candidatus Thermoplasmatota archaeon]|nr:KH domain-containing protein [Candidatus Thermoplasmatota archaeon]